MALERVFAALFRPNRQGASLARPRVVYPGIDDELRRAIQKALAFVVAQPQEKKRRK